MIRAVRAGNLRCAYAVGGGRLAGIPSTRRESFVNRSIVFPRTMAKLLAANRTRLVCRSQGDVLWTRALLQID